MTFAILGSLFQFWDNFSKNFIFCCPKTVLYFVTQDDRENNCQILTPQEVLYEEIAIFVRDDGGGFAAALAFCLSAGAGQP